MELTLKRKILKDFEQQIQRAYSYEETRGIFAQAKIYLDAAQTLMNKYKLTFDEVQILVQEKNYAIKENII
jgi:hypothetical protein